MSSNNNATACWWPNGQTNGATRKNPQADPFFVPCDPSARHSACCALGESCTENGLCYSGSGGIYRGACTDSTWQDSACAKVCRGTSGANRGVQDTFDFLQNCGQATEGRIWACQSNPCSNTSQTFNLIIGGIRQTNITGLLATSPSSSSCPSLPSSSLSTSAGSGTQSVCPDAAAMATSTVAVGAGVGAALGVAFLSALIWAIFERRKRKALIAQYSTVPQYQGEAPPPPTAQYQYPPQQSYTAPPSVDRKQVGVQEQARYELSNENGRAEIG